MSHRKVTTPIPTVELHQVPDFQPTLNAAFQELCTNFSCSDASEHLVELMRLATLADEWAEYTDDFKNNIWWQTQCLRQFFNTISFNKTLTR